MPPNSAWRANLRRTGPGEPARNLSERPRNWTKGLKALSGRADAEGMTTSSALKTIKALLAASVAGVLLSAAPSPTLGSAADQPVAIAGKDVKTSGGGRKIG